MTAPSIHILLVEDNPGDARLIEEMLKESSVGGFSIHWTDRLSSGIAHLLENHVDVVLLDLSLPDSHGGETISRMHEAAPNAPIIVMTGDTDGTHALSAIQEGVQDYLIKDEIVPELLGRSILYAIERKRSEYRLLRLNQMLRAVRNINLIITWEKDHEQLLLKICNSLVNILGYKSAWLALTNESGGLRLAASAGIADSASGVIARDLERGKLPECAIRSMESPGILTIEPHSPHCAHCPVGRNNTDAVAKAMRLEYAGRVFGTLCVRLPQEQAEEPEAESLFEELVHDIAFALHTGEADIARKQAETALRSNLHFMQTLLDTIPNPVFFKNRKGVYQGCNVAFAEQIMGMKRQHFIGKPLRELSNIIPQDLLIIYRNKDEELFNNPGIQFYEAEVLCADKKRRSFFFNKATYNNDIGQVAGIVGVMVDLSERKKLEQQLRQA